MSGTFECVNTSVACLVVFSDLVPFDLSLCINLDLINISAFRDRKMIGYARLLQRYITIWNR